MRRSLASLQTRAREVESVEKAVTAIAGLLSAAMKGERFPEDETDAKGSEFDEKEDEAAKSIPTMGIPQLMRSLSGASRTTGKVGLTSPPNLAVVRKGNEWDAAITDADNRGDHREVLRLSTLRMRQNAAAAGAPVDARLLHGADFQLTPVSLRQPI